MAPASQSALISTRLPSEMKARFAALAAQHGLTESGLVAKLVGEVLRGNASAKVDSPRVASERVAGGGARGEDRLTVRLRQGDRGRAEDLAEARGIKPATYLTLLIHNHVNATDVLPSHELDALKASTAHMAALGRELRKFAVPNSPDADDLSTLRDLLEHVGHEVASAREASSAVVKRNLQSWEGAHA